MKKVTRVSRSRAVVYTHHNGSELGEAHEARSYPPTNCCAVDLSSWQGREGQSSWQGREGHILEDVLGLCEEALLSGCSSSKQKGATRIESGLCAIAGQVKCRGPSWRLKERKMPSGVGLWCQWREGGCHRQATRRMRQKESHKHLWQSTLGFLLVFFEVCALHSHEKKPEGETLGLRLDEALSTEKRIPLQIL